MLIAQTFFFFKIKVLTEHLTKFSFYPRSHLFYLCLQQICICHFIYVQLHFFWIFWHLLCVKPVGCLICVLNRTWVIVLLAPNRQFSNVLTTVVIFSVTGVLSTACRTVRCTWFSLNSGLYIASSCSKWRLYSTEKR